ncbi:hypothetical protein PPL_11784 [Heterostelium album PN500]|uniref:WD40 repeat-containing protein n=1 Tax=Heterostelium pallidum (strain ATCC 26659 / Pp 5 / PN500) TaxID=670386 RepID=D3BUG4_HETP5|nr:hypothetical protein PPL_11784 [Heterostelium album PN500]EFA74752.1 hypothetical protein PPL_11784 [Heterostelium album PN500]|eukprot:XP_020426886.1 hypothetical protein PPL_11784 [Heterostelium album PN500]
MMMATATTLSFSSGGVPTTTLNTSGSRDTLVQHLHSSFYKNTDNHSTGSLYSKDDNEDDDDMFYDCLETNPSWTSSLTPSNLTPRGAGFHSYNNMLRSSGAAIGVEKLSPLPPSTTPLPSPIQSAPSLLHTTTTATITSTSSSSLLSTTTTIMSSTSTSSSISTTSTNNSTNKTMSISPQSALSTLSKDSPTQSTSSSPSTSPNISPSSSPSMSALHYHPSSSHSSTSSSAASQQANNNSNNNTVKSKRNSKVLNIIKTKREELHNLFSSSNNSSSHNKDRAELTQSESSIDYKDHQASHVPHHHSTPSLLTQPPPQESGGRLRKLIKRYSQAENNVCEPNMLNTSNGMPNIQMNNNNSPNNINNNNNNSNSNNNEKERRVSRWLKNLHHHHSNNSNSNSVPNNLKKKSKDLCTDFSLVQTVKGHNGSIWAVDFNLSGTLMATGGSDGVVRVWKVINQVSPDLNEHDYFKSEPIAQFTGHTGHILDIKWMSDTRLLTASIDTNVKLWDVKSNECIRTFEHNDIVVSISLDISQSMFYSSTLDGFIRKWSINNNDDQPIVQTEVGEFITTISLSITPHYLIVTSHLGNILIYSPANLEMIHRFNVSENHTGKKGKGPKITGVTLITSPIHEDCLLISSNDSCIRQYSLKDFKRICKYKGMHLENYQVKPVISPDRKYIIIGSEDSHIYIWNNITEHPSYNEEAKPSKLTIECCEFLTALNKPLTSTIFAPSIIENNIGKYLISTDTTGTILIYNKH